MLSVDPSPEILARWERKRAERLARRDQKRIERFMRLIGGEPRCDLCGASTPQARQERCRNLCK
jgi:hypothetical protein